jgi:hypothetical protein
LRTTTSHRRGFPCSDDLLFHACRRHYPGGTARCCRYHVGRRRPSLKPRQVGFRNFLFEACSAFTHVPACMVAKSPKVTRYQSTSTHLLPPAPPWLLPAERPIGRVGFAPTENRRLSRHTRFLERLTRGVGGRVIDTLSQSIEPLRARMCLPSALVMLPNSASVVNTAARKPLAVSPWVGSIYAPTFRHRLQE